jgi:hypothetical protein
MGAIALLAQLARPLLLFCVYESYSVGPLVHLYMNEIFFVHLKLISNKSNGVYIL